MAIKRIGEVNTAANAHSDKSEYDKWAILEQMRAFDLKQNTKTGFRNSTGMSQVDYKKQAEKAKKQGFEAILREEMKKRA